MSLANRMKESRKVTIEVGEMKFFGRRPSLEEFGKMYNANANAFDIARKFINGWENVKEKDLFSGGSDEVVAFDQEIFSEYISDTTDVAEKIRDALIDSLNKYLETKESLKKLIDWFNFQEVKNNFLKLNQLI